LALCELFRKWNNQELLGEYSGFFKFAKKLNRYHPKPFTKQGKDSFDLTYKYHYSTNPFDPTRLHVRHFPEQAQQFLRSLHKGSQVHAELIAHDKVLQALAWNQQTGWVDDPLAKDLRLVCDQVLSLVRANPEQTTGAMPEFTGLLAPPAVSFFVGREDAIKQYRQYFQSNQALLIAPPITGPGGIGKTQLALRILKKQVQKEDYGHVLWIPAESEARLIEAYLRMAEGMGVYIDKKDIPQTIHRVRLHLKDRRCLYVFDDAPSLQAIQDYLPLQQGHVLITSRNGKRIDWSEEVPPLRLQPFDEQEALLLAKRFGYGQGDTEISSLRTLLKQVPCYPLTLVQLLSTLQDEGYTAATFLTALKNYDTTQQEQELIKLLSALPYARVGYAQSMVYVLKASLEKLSKEQRGTEAIDLLSKLAYLDPKGIPVDWILTWDKQDASFLQWTVRTALSLLEKYSLIQWERVEQKVYIHAETQLIIRHLRPQATLKGLIDSLMDYVGNEEELYENIDKWISLLSHGRVL
ncbi:MAG: NB-ARC domain-containing protein, partial [Bacteroidota bacterium]